MALAAINVKETACRARSKAYYGRVGNEKKTTWNLESSEELLPWIFALRAVFQH